jgi:hypothetical protein
MILGWYAIYDDFSVYSSENTSPEELPVDGIQWIIEVVEGGFRNVHGMDYYRWTGDSWAGGGLNDLEKWLKIRNGTPIILYGRWMDDEGYQKIREIGRDLKYDD